MPKDPKETTRLMKIAMQVQKEIERPEHAIVPSLSALLGRGSMARGLEIVGETLTIEIEGGHDTYLSRWALSAGAVLEGNAGDPADTRAALLRHAAHTLRLLERLDAEGT